MSKNQTLTTVAITPAERSNGLLAAWVGRLVITSIALFIAWERPAQAGDSLSVASQSVSGSSGSSGGSENSGGSNQEKTEKAKKKSDHHARNNQNCNASNQSVWDPWRRNCQSAPQVPTQSSFNADDSNPLGWAVAAVVGTAALTTVPFWGPAVLAEDKYSDWGYFSKYPYEFDTGYMLVNPGELVDEAGEPREAFLYAFRGRTEYGTDFGKISWLDSQLLVETTSRLGGEASWRQLTEVLPAGGHDRLNLGDANLFFRFAQNEKFQARAGAGFNWLNDPHQTSYGYNFTYAMDWFPIRPFITSLEADAGTLGKTSIFHLRATQGINWRAGEVYLGYDYLDIGNFQLGGMIAGVRLWF